MKRYLIPLILLLLLPNLYALEIKVKTDKDFYVAGEVVKVEGKVSEVDKGYAIAIQVRDPDGNLWAIAQTFPEDNGNFSSSIATISPKSPLGEYKVLVSYKGVSTQTSFKVIAKLNLILSKDNLSYGEETFIKVEGIQGYKVITEVSRDKENWVKIKEEDFSYGTYEFSWRPSLVGSYFLRAKVLSKDNQLMGISDVKEVNVLAQSLNFMAHKENSNTFYVKIITNSTLQDPKFSIEEKELSWVSKTIEPSLVKVEVTIPLTLLDGKYSIFIDNKEVNFIEKRNQTHALLTFQYSSNTSDQKIRVMGTTVIPEFPNILFISIFAFSLLYLSKRFLKFC